jgi:hypothetical protein
MRRGSASPLVNVREATLHPRLCFRKGRMKADVCNDEIKADILGNINPSTEFFE